MLDIIASLFDALRIQIGYVLAWVGSLIGSFRGLFYDWFIQLLGWAKDRLPPEVASYFDKGIIPESLSGVVDLALYLIPLEAMFLIWGGSMTIVATIRLLRWIKSFIPTVGD